MVSGWTALPATAEAPYRELFMLFESLGDNCEFGLVQRHFGAEPLGMLRFSGIPAFHLAETIFDDMPEFVDPDKIVLEPRGGEWWITIPSLRYMAHTNLPSNMPEPEAKRKAMTHIGFLRGLLLERFASGDKLFVHKSRDGIYQLAALNYLHYAIMQYSAARLLTIFLADDLHPPGTVVRRDDGLYIGYIDRLSSISDPAVISFDCWLTICRKVARMWNSDMESSKGLIESGSGP